VSNLNKIVDLDTLLDPRPSKPRAIHGRVCPDLHIVVNLDDPGLRNSLLTPVAKFIAKPIRSNHHSGLKDHTIAIMERSRIVTCGNV